MASALPTIIDHLIALLDGSASGVDRSIATGSFVHVPFSPLLALPRTVEAPYPFEIEDQPSDGIEPSMDNVAGDYRWSKTRHTVRVAYAMTPHDEDIRNDVVREDFRKIRRCITDPSSWDAVVASFGGCDIVAMRMADDRPPGDKGIDQALLLLEVDIDLTYYEDYST